MSDSKPARRWDAASYHKVSGPMVVKPGDIVQIGNTVMELQ